MRIGLDFDNTIVNYDPVFHLVAREGGHIPADLPRSKLRVRDHLRGIGQEDVWTEMQGTVYGARMGDASPYPGALAFMRWAREAGHDLFIISHKTRHPYRGTPYDLHKAARDWIAEVLAADGAPLVAPERVTFDLTKDDKIARIGATGCDVFVDDLPEILLAPAFPHGVARILFDPDGHHRDVAGVTAVRSWDDIRGALPAA